MRELQLDGIHDDGDHVVLTDSDGETYTLRIDEALRAAVRRDRPALGMIQAAEHAPLRPREIQALLRSGRDAEEIARIAGVDAEHVRRYEGPVLAERGWIAERARTFHVGRGGGPTLGETVEQRLQARQASPEVAWDAWRRPDGTWTVQLVFEAGGRAREAHWHVDMTRQSVIADDDEARWMTEEESADQETPRPRLAAVRGRVYDVEADGGVERTSTAAPRRGPREEHPTAIGEEELDALNARRGLRSLPRETEDDAEASVWTSLDEEAISEHDRESVEPAGGDIDTESEDEDLTSQTDPDEGPEGGSAEGQEQTEESAGSEEESRRGTESHHGDTVELTPLPGFDKASGSTDSEAPQGAEGADSGSGRPGRRKPRTKRATMPSWDEIVFGSKND